MISRYYKLAKPGIIYGNALTAAAGFFVASHSPIDFKLLILMLIGISLIIGSGCVFNNVIDRDIDAKMERTKKRALVVGDISPNAALLYGTLLSLAGVIALLNTNLLTLFVALAGLFIYVVAYSLWSKRNTLHASIIGAVAGAVPPVVGFTSVTDSIGITGVILFFILFTWQMPHALAIAIRRIDDYRAARIPVMPLAISLKAAKLQIFAYAVAYVLASLALSITGFAGQFYTIGMSVLAFLWLALCISGFSAKNDKEWAKRIFLFSLILLLAFCLLSALDSILG